MELEPMELAPMEITQARIPSHMRSNSPPCFANVAVETGLAPSPEAGQLKILWHSLISRAGIWRALVRRAGSKRKTLAVRESAALGDRRFVSVIQFERQRFLIGSSPSAITLLAQLPDEPASGEEAGEESKKESGGKN